MTFTKLLFVASISAVLFISCKQTASAPGEKTVAKSKSTINPEKLEKATFNIEGMTCAIGCAKTIEKELSETDGVQNATVDFDKKEATVSFDSSIQNPESITKIVEATADGETYKVSNMVASK
ncbi:MAG: heavy-metal-associated domain-containing protein [Flavobacterium sp.]|nr:heavy-metal-associated domain-containing protein [Flavobacterium sp.]